MKSLATAGPTATDAVAATAGPTATDAVVGTGGSSRVGTGLHDGPLRGDDPPPGNGEDHPGRIHGLPTLPLAAGAYLLISVALWWNVWSTHPTSATVCGCGDPSLFTWFLEWPAYALSHGLDPLYSSAMFHPTGVNLLSNTSEIAIGVGLAPITWLFGPVATLNVALTLSPALSGLAMFVLLRRWVSWSPAAFVGGMLYGFSPLVISNLTNAHLMVGLLVVPPLVLACLDELLFRQKRRPVPTGMALGMLCVVQFFIGTEMLLIMVITGVLGVGVVVAHAALRNRALLRRHVDHAAKGLGAAALIAGVLLAYPVWFALAGPAHLSGQIWPDLLPGLFGTGLGALVHLHPTTAATQQARRLGGYQGVALHQTEYLGYGLVAVMVVGIVLWRRDPKLRLFGSMGAVSIALSLTIASSYWVPWRILRRIPIVLDIIPDRFMAMAFLCAGVVIGLVLDHCHRSVIEWPGRSSGLDSRSRIPTGPWWRRSAAGVAAAVGLIALAPVATAYSGRVPLAVRPVVLPRWFDTVAPHLPAGEVLLPYPSTAAGFQSVLTWQAVDRMSFSVVGGGGPGEVFQRAGKQRQAEIVLGNASLFLDPATAFTASTVAAVRQALVAWGVTKVVIPDQPDLPAYEQGFHTAYAVGLITLALRTRPEVHAEAWTWNVGPAVPSPPPIDPATFRSCVGAHNYPTGPALSVPDCVLQGLSSPGRSSPE